MRQSHPQSALLVSTDIACHDKGTNTVLLLLLVRIFPVFSAPDTDYRRPNNYIIDPSNRLPVQLCFRKSFYFIILRKREHKGLKSHCFLSPQFPANELIVSEKSLNKHVFSISEDPANKMSKNLIGCFSQIDFARSSYSRCYSFISCRFRTVIPSMHIKISVSV